MYKSNKFYVVDFTDSTKFKDYDALQFHFKRNDSKDLLLFSTVKHEEKNMQEIEITNIL